MQKNAILNYFQPRNVTSEAEGIARTILDNVLINTDIAFHLANEIVNSAFESAQPKKPAAHSGIRVNQKTFKGWKEKFPWLMVNRVK